MSSAAELKQLTVPKLKELLLAQSLSAVGKKDELIARLLEASPAAPSTVPASEPQSTESTSNPASTAPTATPVIPVATPTVVQPTAEEIALRTSVEEEKRRARALKFGIDTTPAVPAGTAAVEGGEGKGEDKLKSRKERFGIADEKPVDLNKSVAALDQPLGANKPERKSKVAVATAGLVIVAKAVEKKVVEKVLEVVDPELKAKQAAEEEKRVKRAARFGPAVAAEEPAEKKLKTVA